MSFTLSAASGAHAGNTSTTTTIGVALTSASLATVEISATVA